MRRLTPANVIYAVTVLAGAAFLTAALLTRHPLPPAPPRALAAVQTAGWCPLPNASFDCALAHGHESSRTVEGLLLKPTHVETAQGRKPAGWNEAEDGPYIEGTPYILGNLLWLDTGAGGRMSFYYPLGQSLDDVWTLYMAEGRPDRRVRVQYDPACGLALSLSMIEPEPTPEPTPAPTPTPTPTPTPDCPRKQPMPRTEAGRNKVTAELWKRRCRRAEELRGDYDRFEYVP